MSDFSSLATLASALAPWLDRVVLVGGWAHRLHRMHPLARDPGHEPLLTLDADVVLPSDASLEKSDIRARLEEQFTPEYSGNDTPPVTDYRPKNEAGGVYAEFLMPLVGSEYKQGRLDATGTVGGVAATKLRYLELLTVSPWTTRSNSSPTASMN